MLGNRLNVINGTTVAALDHIWLGVFHRSSAYYIRYRLSIRSTSWGPWLIVASSSFTDWLLEQMFYDLLRILGRVEKHALGEWEHPLIP